MRRINRFAQSLLYFGLGSIAAGTVCGLGFSTNLDSGLRPSDRERLRRLGVSGLEHLAQLPQQPGDPSDDFQLKTALDTLRTWQIFRAALVGTASKTAASSQP